MKEYRNAAILCNTLEEAWICVDELISFVEEHDLWDRFEEVAENRMKEVEKINGMLWSFYQFSGSDDSCWDEWTDPIMEFAGNLLGDVMRDLGMEVE